MYVRNGRSCDFSQVVILYSRRLSSHFNHTVLLSLFVELFTRCFSSHQTRSCESLAKDLCTVLLPSSCPSSFTARRDPTIHCNSGAPTGIEINELAQRLPWQSAGMRGHRTVQHRVAKLEPCARGQRNEYACGVKKTELRSRFFAWSEVPNVKITITLTNNQLPKGIYLLKYLGKKRPKLTRNDETVQSSLLNHNCRTNLIPDT